MADPFATLNDVGPILARGVRQRPYVAASVLTFLILAVALTVIALASGSLETGLLLVIAVLVALAGLLTVLLFRLEVRTMRVELRDSVKVPSKSLTGDTVRLASVLNKETKRSIRDSIERAAQDVSEQLGVFPELVRSNVFACDEHNIMRMLSDFTYHMKKEDELSITMPAGYGSTGRCYRYARPNIAIFRKNWGKDMIEDAELKKAHPELQWIISVPIFLGNGRFKPVWVLNVDGLRERREENELKRCVGKLANWSTAISMSLASALNALEAGQHET